MHEALRRLDLNLLLVFHAIYRHGTVLEAADELALSPSACSHAIARLRRALGDEVFVRQGHRMQPTPAAAQLAPAVSSALAILSESIEDRGAFDPATTRQRFVIAATDYTSLAVLPGLASELETAAPHCTVKVVSLARREAMDELATGRIHLALGFSDIQGGNYPGVTSKELFSDDYVVMVRDGHSRIGKTLSLADYLSARHIAVTPWADAGSVIDAVLSEHGKKRMVAVTLPTLLVAPYCVVESDLLLTLPRKAASILGRGLPVRLFEAPFTVPTYSLRAYLHGQHSATRAMTWLLNQVSHPRPM